MSEHIKPYEDEEPQPKPDHLKLRLRTFRPVDFTGLLGPLLEEALERIEALEAQLLEKDLILVTSNMKLRERLQQLEKALQDIYHIHAPVTSEIARRTLEDL